MQVKRFVAADMRRALELVRQELGPDAIILSSSRTKDGVELLTTLAADSELAQLQQAAQVRSLPTPAVQTAPEPAHRPTSFAPAFAEASALSRAMDAENYSASGKSEQELADEMERARERMLASRRAEASAKSLLREQQERISQPAPRIQEDMPVRAATRAPSAAERYPLVDTQEENYPVRAAAESQQLSDLQAELADMRFMLEQQLQALTGQQGMASSPVLASVGRRLERMGFTSNIIANVLTRCKRQDVLPEAWADAQANLARQLPVAGRDVVDQGGIYAFVGPTGVGKTTTIGKLAARFVLRHGADSVALITTDTYRIAAHDQLRSMARIMRVPVRVVEDKQELGQVIDSLKNYKLILIDTAGFRHGDPHLTAQLQSLAKQPEIKTLLVLSSNSQQQMLKASIHAYGAAGLKGCILTKLDETASLGEALSVIQQSKLPLVYTTDGQDIPKHIEVARGHQLVTRAAGLLKSQMRPSTPVSSQQRTRALV
ncbi:flagellar biosynthesis protein FlhF [Cellvibrio polysaccharolyticus]|uniref:Flagellar biosynthesis protein FlhF n=1 Tax=Cellvibrio polysaccharolyticus TaxID=2082724 RepID=A0A928V6F3_9GAMM|nr:flagellar biosynthesis protein FlhF [Cellvibrio polysaccharolyticus]MBE8717414.1 flagellar biosynthesis protein FlhF [Cellvibrio polysaccharolyticus]